MTVTVEQCAEVRKHKCPICKGPLDLVWQGVSRYRVSCLQNDNDNDSDDDPVCAFVDQYFTTPEAAIHDVILTEVAAERDEVESLYREYQTLKSWVEIERDQALAKIAELEAAAGKVRDDTLEEVMDIIHWASDRYTKRSGPVSTGTTISNWFLLRIRALKREGK